MVPDPSLETPEGEEGAREEIADIISEGDESGYGSTLQDLSLSAVTYINPLNPKSQANLRRGAALQKALGKVTAQSQAFGKRWTQIRAYNINAQNYANAIPGHPDENVGLVIRANYKPCNGVGWDEVTHIEDVTVYAPMMVAPPVPTIKFGVGNVFLLYDLYAFQQSGPGVFNYAQINGIIQLTIRVHYMSGHTEDFDMQCPVGINYASSFPFGSVPGQDTTHPDTGAIIPANRIWLSTADCYGVGYSWAYYPQSKTAQWTDNAEPQDDYMLGTYFKPVANPTGLFAEAAAVILQRPVWWVNVYGLQNVNTAYYSLAVGRMNYLNFQEHNCTIGGNIAYVHPDGLDPTNVLGGTAAKQEMHRIDVIATHKNNFAHPSTIDGMTFEDFRNDWNPAFCYHCGGTGDYITLNSAIAYPVNQGNPVGTITGVQGADLNYGDSDSFVQDGTLGITPGSQGSFDSVVNSIIGKSVNQMFTYMVYYAENLVDCVGAATTYDVCDASGNPSNFMTTSKDCAGNNIPAADMPGGANYNLGNVAFNSFFDPPCCTDCEGLTLTITSFHCSSSGSTDGFVHWTVEDPMATPPTKYTGTPFGSNSRYKVEILNSTGTTAGIPGTQAPAGGAATGAVTITHNNTVGTSHTFTVPANDQIVPGMIISGHTWYDAATGGSVVTGNVHVGGFTVSNLAVGVIPGVMAGSLNNGATQFYAVDESDNIVYSQASSGTQSCTFSTSYTGLFGDLEPNTGANPFYTVVVTDNNSVSPGCSQSINFIIDDGGVLAGCTDSGYLNYNAAAGVDDGSCIRCDSADGLLHSPLGATTDMWDSLSASSPQAATFNTGTGVHNTDGTLDVSGSIIAAVQPYIDIDANSTMVVKLYTVSAMGNSYTTGTLVATHTTATLNNIGVTFNHQFTGLAYGYYAITVQFVDSNSVSNAEDCLSEWHSLVKGEVCDDLLHASYTAAPADAALREQNNALLCPSHPCCMLMDILEDMSIHGTSCNPFLYANVECNPDRDVDVIWSFDDGTGWIVIATYNIGTIGMPPPLQTLWASLANDPANGSLFGVYGSGDYKVEIQATDASGGVCVETMDHSFIYPASSCHDNAANNTNFSEICPCTGCCEYDSYECDGNGNCINTPVNDPLDVIHATDVLCYANNGCPGGTYYGCTDSCAINYDPLATIDDGSCTYTACLHPYAQNYLYQCCLGQYISAPQATVNDPSCCSGGCQNVNTLGFGTGPSTGTCTNFTGDGTVNLVTTIYTGATTWTWEIYDASGVTLIYSDPNTYTSGQSSAVYDLLMYGTYTGVATDNLGCVNSGTFTITTTAPEVGCTDPDSINYSPDAVCDCCCIIQGCMDPNAANYDPNATIPGQCVYPPIPPSPCLPPQLEEDHTNILACLTIKGTEWLQDYKIGRTVDCSMMDKWKLILINYLLNQKDLSCLFNCADLNTPPPTIVENCHKKWEVGGLSTGQNHDPNHFGTLGTPAAGLGTTVTAYDNYPNGWFGFDGTAPGPIVTHPTAGGPYSGGAKHNLTYNEDVIKWDLPAGHPLAKVLNGTIWTLTAEPAGVGTWNLNKLHTGCLTAKIKHYRQCLDWRTVSITTTENYYDKFINFVNKFCKDCKSNEIVTKDPRNGQDRQY